MPIIIYTVLLLEEHIDTPGFDFKVNLKWEVCVINEEGGI